jgi:hypothetical protein
VGVAEVMMTSGCVAADSGRLSGSICGGVGTAATGADIGAEAGCGTGLAACGAPDVT